MIGDTITLPDNHTATGVLPDSTSDTVVLAKVNQDGFGSEYRYRGAAYDYRLLVRNSIEAPRKDGTVLNRHNIEVQATLRATADGSVPKDVPYYASMTIRAPSSGDSSVLLAVAGALGKLLSVNDDVLEKLDNFES